MNSDYRSLMATLIDDQGRASMTCIGARVRDIKHYPPAMRAAALEALCRAVVLVIGDQIDRERAHAAEEDRITLFSMKYEHDLQLGLRQADCVRRFEFGKEVIIAECFEDVARLLQRFPTMMESRLNLLLDRLMTRIDHIQLPG